MSTDHNEGLKTANNPTSILRDAIWHKYISSSLEDRNRTLAEAKDAHTKFMDMVSRHTGGLEDGVQLMMELDDRTRQRVR